ncbi:glucosamine 6-phosphate N-acetyltransferase [Entamoeba marina]
MSEFETPVFVTNKQFKSLDNIVVRPLQRNDYSKGFTSILAQLTTCEMNEEEFLAVFNTMKSSQNYYVVVAEDITKKSIIFSGTLLVETKFIHRGGLVGHIEDIVVSSEYRGLNLGKLLIETLLNIAKEKGCYKVILDCEDKVVKFYEKCGLEYKNNCMAVYF